MQVPSSWHDDYHAMRLRLLCSVAQNPYVSSLGESHESRGDLEVTQVTKRPGRHKIYCTDTVVNVNFLRFGFTSNLKEVTGFFLDGPIQETPCGNQ